jgi:hypothetical protein
MKLLYAILKSTFLIIQAMPDPCLAQRFREISGLQLARLKTCIRLNQGVTIPAPRVAESMVGPTAI